jgi:transposase InsO family protein
MTTQGTQGQIHEDAKVQRRRRLGGVSRAGYCRRFEASAPPRADAELRDRIQKLNLKHRHDGYRRIAAQLRREGRIVNAKRVLRLMP